MLALLILSALPAYTADLQAAPLDDILGKLDRAASAFKGMTADLNQTAHTAVIDEDNTESGTIRMKRVKPGDTRMLVDFHQPDPKTVQLQGQSLYIYLPKIQTVQEFDLGKNSTLLEQFLLLGFGTNRRDLEAANDIKFVDAQPLNGHPAVRLELTPKSAEVLQHVKKIELWLDPATGYPLQHKIYQLGGDYQLFVFDNVQMRPNLPDSDLKLKLPKGVKFERPQH